MSQTIHWWYITISQFREDMNSCYLRVSIIIRYNYYNNDRKCINNYPNMKLYKKLVLLSCYLDYTTRRHIIIYKKPVTANSII